VSSSRRHLALGAVAAATVACDQLTKVAARLLLADGVEHEVLGGVLTLTLVENPGAFLSLGAGWPASLRLVLAVAVVGLLAAVAAAVLRDRTSPTPSRLAAALLLAGGCSNLVDRLWRHGTVTDFALLRAGALHTGVFNVADVAIMAGALLFLWATVRRGAA
jgi:signal peptidase II